MVEIMTSFFIAKGRRAKMRRVGLIRVYCEGGLGIMFLVAKDDRQIG